MKSKKTVSIITGVIAAATVTVASAQEDLSKVISVDKVVVPEEREASRISDVPSLLQPTVKPFKLTMSDKLIQATTPNLVNRLEPAATVEEPIIGEDSRGYVTLGYFPAFNLGLSAGYRLIDFDFTQLGAWVQYNGKSYDGKAKGKDVDMNLNQVALGLDFSHQFMNRNRLDADVTYQFTAYNRPWLDNYKDMNNHRLWFDSKYTGIAEGFDYFAGIKLGGTFFGEGDTVLPEGLWTQDTYKWGEFGFGINGGISSKDVDETAYGIDLRADFNSTGEFVTWDVNPFSRELEVENHGSNIRGLVSLTPYWSGDWGNVKAKVGLDVDFGINSGSAFSLAPEASAEWIPGFGKSMFGTYLTVTGGTHQNSLGSLLDYSPYLDPTFGHEHSRVPFDGTFGMVFGPFMGVSLDLHANYSKANDWLMPILVKGFNYWSAIDLDGFRFGAKLSYKSKLVKSLTVSYDHVSNDGDNGYYLWRDHASDVLDAQLTVNVIKPLDVSLGFEARWGRKMNVYDSNSPEFGTVSLGKSNNLSVGAIYRVTDKFSVFGRGENLLGTKWDILYGIPAQGLTGLVGATYTF